MCANTLAMALAECGRFAEAEEWQQKALDMLADKDADTRKEYLRQLTLFQSNQPLRFAPKTS